MVLLYAGICSGQVKPTAIRSYIFIPEEQKAEVSLNDVRQFDFRVVSTTKQAIKHCETVIEIKTYQPVTYSQILSKLEFYDSNSKAVDSRISNLKFYRQETVQQAPVIISPGKTLKVTEGSDIKPITKPEWKEFDPRYKLETIPANTTVLLKWTLDKPFKWGASAGYNSVEWVPVIMNDFAVKELDWYDSDWQYRIKLTVDADQVSNDTDVSQTNFPVYVDLSDLPAGFFSNIQAAGQDIRITTSNGETECPLEIVAIDTGASTGELYFKAPSLSGNTDTSFYIYYGNDEASAYAVDATYGAENVWNSNYKGIWHKDDVTTSTISDSTTNDNDGAKRAANEPIEATGKIGNAQDYEGFLAGGTSDYISITDNATLDFGAGNNFTLSTWFNSSTAADQRIIFKYKPTDAKGYSIFLQSTGQVWGVTWSTTSVVAKATDAAYNDGAWHHATLVRNQSSGLLTLYVDGAFKQELAESSRDIANTNALVFGSANDYNYGYTGLIDEVRISDSVRSYDWNKTEYNNQSNTATFYTLGSIESNNVRRSRNWFMLMN